VDEVADTSPLLPTGVYHARVLPLLSAAVSVQAIKNKRGKVTEHKLTVTVTDAGDAVAGATVSIKGHTKKTNIHGLAKVSLTSPLSGHVTVTVTAPTYQVLGKKVEL
jgi:hypothetical protein